MCDTKKNSQDFEIDEDINFDDINTNITKKIEKNKNIEYKNSKQFIEEFKDIDPIYFDKNFRIANVKLMLTYSGIIDKQSLKKFISNQTYPQMSGKFKNLLVAHEKHKKEKYNMTHVLIEFNKKYETIKKDIFDFENYQPTIRKIVSKIRWDASIKYFSTNDEEIKNELENKLSLVENIMNCSSELEALKKFVIKPSDAIGVSSIFKMKKENEVFETDIKELYLWQQSLKQLVETKPNGRTIYWIYDKTGGSGKTEFIKYYSHETKSEDKCRFTKHLNCRDLSTTVQGWVEDERWRGNTIFIDLVRSLEDKKIYEGLEMLADSMATSQKYKGKSIVWKKCHIIVFSNFLPKINCLSLDRWCILELYKTNDNDIDCVLLDINDIKNKEEEQEEDAEINKLVEEHFEREKRKKIEAKAKIIIDKKEREESSSKNKKTFTKNEKEPIVNEVPIIKKKEEIVEESPKKVCKKKKSPKIVFEETESDEDTDSLED